MEIAFCNSCNRETGFKRDIGWGTFFGSIVTFGLLIFLIPFYPKRCVVCGNEFTKSPNNYYKGNSSGTDAIPLGQIQYERECPHCAELILKKAHVCKHCGRDVEPIIDPLIAIDPSIDKDADATIARFISTNTYESNLNLAKYHLKKNEIRYAVAYLEGAIAKSPPKSKTHIEAYGLLNDIKRKYSL